MYELWFRAVYENDLAKRMFTAALRPGSRLPGQDKGVSVGEIVRIKVLDRFSVDSQNPSQTFREFTCLAQITNLTVKKISELNPQDLVRCSPDSKDPKLATYHLGLIYNRQFSTDELVTIVEWKYKED